MSPQVCLEAFLKEKADGTLQPKIATSWVINNDPKNPSITFTFRKGVRFHDGTELNARVASWSIQKLKDSGLFASVRYLKSLEVKDDYTLYIPMTEWRSSLMPAFAKNQHYLVSPTALENKGIDWLRWNMVGTGPFKQLSYQKDVVLKTVRNEDYWQPGKPYLFGVDYLFIADEMTRNALFRSGGAEVLNTAGNARVASEFAAQGYKVVAQVSGAEILIPDSANATSPWANLKVRQAAEYAIDKEAIAKAFGFGYWKAANQVPSPEAPAHTPTLPGRKYDTAKAKQLLSEAGFPNGFKTKIIAANTANKDILVALQSHLAAVGIQVDLDFVEPMKVTEFQSKGWNNALLYILMAGEGNYIPSIGFNFPPARTGRYTVVKDPPNWKAIYDKAGTSAVMEPKLTQGFTQAQYDDVMLIPIYWETALYVLRSNVQDFGLGTLGVGLWECADTWLSK